MKYCDAHNHLQDYASEPELEAALAAAAAAKVERMLCCGTCPADWGRVLELAGRCPGVTPAYGLHPCRPEEPGWLGRLEEFLRRSPCCVGEIGLDGLAGLPGHEEAFAAQLELAARYGRPAVIHCVKSWGKLLEVLRAVKPAVFMLHAYSGSPELVRELAALGGYFSFGGELLDPRRQKLRAALAAAPEDRLLFETESPDPGGLPWRRGPAALPEVAAAAAELLGRGAEDLGELSCRNFSRFTGT